MGNKANKFLHSSTTGSNISTTYIIPSLPLDVWFIIISFVNFEERGKLALVNREFRKFVLKNKDLWFEKDFYEAVIESERLSPPPTLLGTINIYHHDEKRSLDIYNSMYWPKCNFEKKLVDLFPELKGNRVLGLYEKHTDGVLINIKGGMSSIFRNAINKNISEYFLELFSTGSMQWRTDRDHQEKKMFIEEVKNWKKKKKEWDQGCRICTKCLKTFQLSTGVEFKTPLFCNHVAEKELISLDHYICYCLGHPI